MAGELFADGVADELGLVAVRFAHAIQQRRRQIIRAMKVYQAGFGVFLAFGHKCFVVGISLVAL